MPAVRSQSEMLFRRDATMASDKQGIRARDPANPPGGRGGREGAPGSSELGCATLGSENVSMLAARQLFMFYCLRLLQCQLLLVRPAAVHNSTPTLTGMPSSRTAARLVIAQDDSNLGLTRCMWHRLANLLGLNLQVLNWTRDGMPTWAR